MASGVDSATQETYSILLGPASAIVTTNVEKTPRRSCSWKLGPHGSSDRTLLSGHDSQSLDRTLRKGVTNNARAVFRESSKALGVAEIDHDRSRPEPIRLVSHIEDSDRKPDAADCFRDDIEISPDEAAEKKSDDRKHRILKNPTLISLLAPNTELPETSHVHAHEGKKCTKI